MTEFRLYRGTTTKYIHDGMIFPHPPRITSYAGMMVKPRIYFTPDRQEAMLYAVIEWRKSGGDPRVVEIDLSKVRGRLRRGTESEFIREGRTWRSGEWYILVPSWQSGFAAINKIRQVDPEWVAMYADISPGSLPEEN